MAAKKIQKGPESTEKLDYDSSEETRFGESVDLWCLNQIVSAESLDTEGFTTGEEGNRQHKRRYDYGYD